MEKKILKKFGILRSSLVVLIRLYQKILSPILSALFQGGCRFYPSCSDYALFCFQYLPLYRAFYLSISRILRCQPYSKGGFDEPPGWYGVYSCSNEKINNK